MKKIVTLIIVMMVLLSSMAFAEGIKESDEIFMYDLEYLRDFGPITDSDYTLTIGYNHILIIDKNGKTIEDFGSVKDKLLGYDSYQMTSDKNQMLILNIVKSNAEVIEEVDAEGYVDDYLKADIDVQLDFGSNKKYSFKTPMKIMRRFSTSVPYPYQGTWINGQHKLEIDDFVLRYTNTETNLVRTFQMAQTATDKIPYRSREYSVRLFNFEGSEQIEGQLVRNFGEKDYGGSNSINFELNEPDNLDVMTISTGMENMPERIFDLKRTDDRVDLPYIGVKPALFKADKVWDEAVYGDVIPYMPLPVGNQVNLVWDSGSFNFSKPAQILQGSTMVPAKEYFESFGFSASDDGQQFSMFAMGIEIYAEKGSKEVKIINNGDINGHYTVILSAPVQDVEGTLFVPLRFAANLTNVSLVWYDKNKTASLIGRGSSFPKLEAFEDYRD